MLEPPGELVIRDVGGADLETIRGLLLEYRGTLTAEVCLAGYDDELRTLPGAYAPPGGALLLALVDDEPAGCVALRRLDEHRAELKRLFVRSSARGHGLGRRLVELAVERARKLGYRELLLDTLPSMVAAQHLYEVLGFRDCPRWDGASADERRFMSLAL